MAPINNHHSAHIQEGGMEEAGDFDAQQPFCIETPILKSGMRGAPQSSTSARISHQR
jgi:hypothetical protein